MPHVQQYKQYSSFLLQQYIWRRPSYRLAGSFGLTVDDVAAQGVCGSPLPCPDASIDWLAASSSP